MKKLLVCVVLALLAASARAGTESGTYANMGTCFDGSPREYFIVDATSATSCAAGGSTFEAHCCCKDGTWAVCATAGGTSNSFETVNAPSGTDPVADSGTDTLNVTCAGGITCTGNSGTDTLALDFASTAFLPATSAPAADAAAAIWYAGGVLSFEGATADAFETFLYNTDPTADRFIQMYDANGYVMLSDCATCTTNVANGVMGTTNGFIFEGTTQNGAETTLTAGDPTADRAIALPDESGTVLTTASGSPYNQYDPDRPPTSVGTGGWSEEWTGNAASQTWTWGNQDAATESITYDSALVTGEATADENRIRTTAAATNADQVLSAKMILGENLVSNTNAGCLLVVITAGTQATPTALQFFGTVDAATDVVHSYSDTDLNPSAGASVHASGTAWTEFDYMSSASYLQIRYTDSTRVTTFHISFDGMTWTPIGTVTPAADPLYWGYSVRDHSICRWQFIRLRTDANRNDVGE